MVLGCDGIFDQLNNEDVVECVNLCLKNDDIHIGTGEAVDMIMKTAMMKRAIDNLTCIVLTFKGIKNNIYNIIENV